MIAVIEIGQFFERANLLAALGSIHFTLAGDMKQILKHSVTGAWLELVLLKISGVVAIFAPQSLILRCEGPCSYVRLRQDTRVGGVWEGSGEPSVSLFRRLVM